MVFVILIGTCRRSWFCSQWDNFDHIYYSVSSLHSFCHLYPGFKLISYEKNPVLLDLDSKALGFIGSMIIFVCIYGGLCPNSHVYGSWNLNFLAMKIVMLLWL